MKTKHTKKDVEFASGYGSILDDGRVWLRATGKVTTFAKLKQQVRSWNRSVRYADKNDCGTNEA